MEDKPDYLKIGIEISIVFFLCVGLWYAGNFWHWSIPVCFGLKLAYYYTVKFAEKYEEARADAQAQAEADEMDDSNG